MGGWRLRRSILPRAAVSLWRQLDRRAAGRSTTHVHQDDVRTNLTMNFVKNFLINFSLSGGFFSQSSEM